MYTSLNDYDRNQAMAEDAVVTSAQAMDRVNDPAVAKCPAASALLPSLKSARTALMTEAGMVPPDADAILPKREALVAIVRKVDEAKAACQGKESPYVIAERQKQEADRQSGSVGGEAGPGSSKAQITAWQQILASKGCNPGPIDGQWGSMTAAATQRFKQGTCAGAGAGAKTGVAPAYKPPPAPPLPPAPVAPPPSAPPIDTGRTARADIISGVPNSALAVGGLAIVALGVAVIVKKRGRGYGPDSIPRTRYQEPADFGPMTVPMSRTSRSAKMSSRRPASSRAKTKRSR